MSAPFGACLAHVAVVCCGFGNLWQSMAIYGNLWQSMAIYGNLWQSMAIFKCCNQAESAEAKRNGVQLPHGLRLIIPLVVRSSTLQTCQRGSKGLKCRCFAGEMNPNILDASKRHVADQGLWPAMSIWNLKRLSLTGTNCTSRLAKKLNKQNNARDDNVINCLWLGYGQP